MRPVPLRRQFHRLRRREISSPRRARAPHRFHATAAADDGRDRFISCFRHNGSGARASLHPPANTYPAPVATHGGAARAQIFVTYGFTLQPPYASPTEASIGEYGLDGTPINSSFIPLLNSPAGLAVSGSDLFVVSGSGVGEYNLNGTPVNTSLITGLSDPSGIAISGSNLFVTSGNGGGVSEYSLNGTPEGTILSGLASTNIAVSGSDIFLLKYSGVEEYNVDGLPVGSGLISGLNATTGMALSGSSLYVVTASGTVGEYTVTGGAVTSSTPSLITNLQSPSSIAVLGSNLYITTGGPDAGISEYTTSGVLENPLLVAFPFGDEGDQGPFPFDSGGIAVIPEPSTCAMLLGGLGVLAFWRKRTRRA